MSNVSGADALTKSVAAIIKQNESTNEVNIAQGLQTSTPTATGALVASNEKIMGDVTRVSAKKKTFGVYSSKQVVEQKTQVTSTEVNDKLSTIDPEIIANLETKLGVAITTDLELASALSLLELMNLDMFSAQFASDSDFDLGSLWEFPNQRRLETGEIIDIGSITDGISPSSTSSMSSIFSGVDLDIPSVSNVTSSVTSLFPNAPDGFPDVSLSDYGTLTDIFSAGLDMFNSCDNLSSMFDGSFLGFDLDSILDGLMNYLKIGGLDNLNCFTELLDKMNDVQLDSLVSGLVDEGDLPNLDTLVDYIGEGKLVAPKDTLAKAISNTTPMYTSDGSVSLFKGNTDISSNADSLLGKFGLDKTSIWEMDSDKAPSGTVDLSSPLNETPGLLEYSFGDDAYMYADF